MKWFKAFLKSLLLLGILVLSIYLGVTLTIFVTILPFLLWMVIVLPVLPAIVMAFVYRITDRLVDLFAKEKSSNQSFWPTFSDWKQGIRAMIVTILTTAFSVASTLSLMIVTGGGAVLFGSLAIWTEEQAINAGYQLADFFGKYEILVKHLAVVWMTCSTCLYRYDDWARSKKQRQKKSLQQTKVKPTQKFVPTDPVTMELERMRTRIGTTKVKRTQKLPTNVPNNPKKSKKRQTDKT